MYILSARSLAKLDGVHPALVDVVQRAIEITPRDFAIIHGVRTMEEQQKLVASGASQTLDSRHLTGHAVDVAAYVNGKIDWTYHHYPMIADAFKKASEELKVPIRWGGSWGLLEGPLNAVQLSAAYIRQREAQGKKPFLDLGHFELPKGWME